MRSTIDEIVDAFCHRGITDRRDERNVHCVITSAAKNSREGNDVMICHSESRRVSTYVHVESTASIVDQVCQMYKMNTKHISTLADLSDRQ